MEITLLQYSFECSVDPLIWRAAIEDIKNEELNKRNRIVK